MLAIDSYKGMTPLAVDFQLELLQGCRFRCNGCHVDINRDPRTSARELERLNKLFKDFQEKSYSLDHLIVAPTDFTVADNFDLLASLPEFWEATSFFGITNFTTTLLSKNWRESLQKIDQNLRSEKASFTFVLNPQKALDEDYLRFFSERAEELKSLFSRPIQRFYIVFNAYPHGEHDQVNFAHDYEKVHNLVTHYFDVPTFDHGLSFTRSENTERISKTMSWLNEIYNGISEQQKIPIEFLNTEDYQAKRYIYREGKFYFAPLWYEPFIRFAKDFEIPTPEWQVEEFESFDHQLLLNQFKDLKTKECYECENNPICLKRGMVSLMSALGTEACIAPRKAIKDRGFYTLPFGEDSNSSQSPFEGQYNG